MTGPLHGVTVLEVGGIGPGPFAGMILADMGATVIRVDRPGATLPFPLPAEHDLANRGKKMVALDLKQPEAVAALLRLVETADIVIEGYRPGVAERIGFGPEVCHQRNPAIVFGRMTGWGQDGPWSQAAGHDINYVSVTGALHAIGDAGGTPQIPINLLGDFAGGSTYLVMGVLAALFEARSTGVGRVVDAAIVDGVSHLLAGVHGFLNGGIWRDERGVNLLDGGAPFYAIYETADGRHMAIGGIEPPFWADMIQRLGIDEAEMGSRHDPAHWPAWRKVLTEAFLARTQQEWTTVFDGTDACVSPVVSLAEAADHPHVAARGSVVRTPAGIAPGAAPRFSGASTSAPRPPAAVGADTAEVLSAAGIDPETLAITV